MSEHMTIDEVREWLDYNPTTGVLTWKKHRRGTNYRKAGGYESAGYGRVMFKGRRYMVTHLIWAWVKGEWPTGWIDHKNRDPHDNRIANLREATPVQNQINKVGFGRTGFKGVFVKTRRKLTKPFYAMLSINSKNTYLGTFATAEEADAVVRAKRREVYGEFA